MLDSFSLSLLARAVFAAVLGFIVGLERKHSGSAAGGRTFALVCLSSAVLTTFAIAAFPASADRIIANLVTGVAFLGAGLILRRDTGEIKGLTTAAGLWATTALGILVGGGYLVEAALLTGIVLVILIWDDIPLIDRLGLRNTHSRATDVRIQARGCVDASESVDAISSEASGSRAGQTASASPRPPEASGQHPAEGHDRQEPQSEWNLDGLPRPAHVRDPREAPVGSRAPASSVQQE
jgi:putative Mg2+ transporter-C (MgtC) family protein